MNNIRTLAVKLLRSYATKPLRESAGVRGKIKLTQTDNFNTDLEELDQEDVEVYEADIGEISESYVNRKRAKQRDREQLKQRIVKSKYFKEKEPRFITYIEKEQIKKLHESDPEQWTPEKLSESFPALPETIRKILKSNWIPSSVETILNYDNRVIENWKNFKTGQLAVSSMLREHLMKFKNRKISLTDRQTLAENFVRRKIDLPKPKSTFFSSIIEDSVREKQLPNDKLPSPRNNVNNNEENASSMQERSVELIKGRNGNFLREEGKNIKKRNERQEELVFDEFLKQKLNNLSESTPEEREALLDTYRKHVECKTVEDVTTNVLDSARKNATDEAKSAGFIKKLSDESALIIKQREAESIVAAKSDTENSSLDTYIKDRKSLMETNFQYTKLIKIPKNVYKKGMTYRISDCYYDDDGQFLYRVPGLRN